MDIIDGHHHLWDMKRLHYPWLLDADGKGIFGSYDAIRHNYLLADYLSENTRYRVVKSVHVEADHDTADPVKETRWLQSLADDPASGGFPNAIVAHADFNRSDVGEVLAAHCHSPNVRGIRQMLNYHTDPKLTYTPRNMLEDPNWLRNFKMLRDFDLSFDLQIYYQQMPEAAALARDNTDILFILDHTGMPVERGEAGIAAWRHGMQRLSEHDNIVVKISGLGMCYPDWDVQTIRPFVLHAIESFGVDRCMFASNFPVDGLFSGFDTLFDAYVEIVRGFSESERGKLFVHNAARYYRL